MTNVDMENTDNALLEIAGMAIEIIRRCEDLSAEPNKLGAALTSAAAICSATTTAQMTQALILKTLGSAS